MVKKLKNLNFSENSFVANGKTYFIETGLSFARWKEFEKLEVHVGYGITFEQMFENDKKIWDALNKANFGEAAVLVHNRMNGIKQKLEARVHPALLLCSLFINLEDEDRVKYDPVKAEKKIEDWGNEGYDFKDFFQLAVNLVQGFIPACKEISQDIFQKKESKKNTTKNG